MESQLGFQNQQHCQQTSFATHFQLMEATQGTLIGRTRELQDANADLTERMAQFSLDRDRRLRSRSRRSGRSPQDGKVLVDLTSFTRYLLPRLVLEHWGQCPIQVWEEHFIAFMSFPLFLFSVISHFSTLFFNNF